jgi:septum formation protein
MKAQVQAVRKLPKLILASASPRRAQLLQQLPFAFEVFPSEATEVAFEHLSAGELVQINAYRKARAVSKKFPDALILGCDTLVTIDAKPLGKPHNLDEAHRMLELLQGRTHLVVTGVCLVHLRTHRQRVFFEGTSVTFRPLGSRHIRDYLGSMNPLDKAGAYAIQENGDSIVAEISGSYSNVVGLPIERLREEISFFATG